MNRRDIRLRREQMLQIIRAEGILTTTNASGIFHITPETVRQDFDFLEKQGVIQRTHGAAKPIRTDSIEKIAVRETENYIIKERIVQKALEYIPSGSVSLGMDTGSTIALLSAHLRRRDDLTIVTNSYRVMQNMLTSQNHVIALGGDYYQDEYAFFSNEIPGYIQNLKLDITFLGTSGTFGHQGTCTKGLAERFTKHIMADRSLKKIVLTDSGKFSVPSPVEVLPWEEIDILITDRNIPDDIYQDLNGKCEIILV